jgi:hypothetical protein
VIDFEKQFAEQDEDDEDDAGLVNVLVAIDNWAKMLANNIHATNGKAPFKANELCVELNSTDWGYSPRDGARTFFYPSLKAEERVGAVSLGCRLKKHVDEPVRRGEGTLILRKEKADDSAMAMRLHEGKYCGSDGTRTRDLRRDRPTAYLTISAAVPTFSVPERAAFRAEVGTLFNEARSRPTSTSSLPRLLG